jgi:hypothetical protein
MPGILEALPPAVLLSIRSAVQEGSAPWINLTVGHPGSEAEAQLRPSEARDLIATLQALLDSAETSGGVW